jgi:hypothetical protein
VGEEFETGDQQPLGISVTGSRLSERPGGQRGSIAGDGSLAVNKLPSAARFRSKPFGTNVAGFPPPFCLMPNFISHRGQCMDARMGSMGRKHVDLSLHHERPRNLKGLLTIARQFPCRRGPEKLPWCCPLSACNSVCLAMHLSDFPSGFPASASNRRWRLTTCSPVSFAAKPTPCSNHANQIRGRRDPVFHRGRHVRRE